MLILKIILILPDVNIKDNIPTSCSCEKSKFRYEPYGHTLSRDLYIKEDRAVINLFCEMDLNIVLFQKSYWSECRRVIYDDVFYYKNGVRANDRKIP